VTAIAVVAHRLVVEPIGLGDDDRRPRHQATRRVDLAILLVLGLGIATAILTVSGILALSLEQYWAPTKASSSA